MLYKVSKEQLLELLECQARWYALEGGGVDNWTWYGESLSEYIKDYVEENNIDISPNELTIADIAEYSLEYFEPVEE